MSKSYKREDATGFLLNPSKLVEDSFCCDVDRLEEVTGALWDLSPQFGRLDLD